MDRVKAVNRTVFLISVLATGAIAGAFVWLILFLMDVGLGMIWDGMSSFFGVLFPIGMCTIGGLVIALFARRYGNYPEDLPTVMAKVKHDGRYEYDKLGRMSVAALLPLIFGGSVGPEAGLTGVIAGLCAWVSDRMKRFGSDFKELTEAGVTATLSALFTAPLYGFAAGMEHDRQMEQHEVSKKTRIVIYIFAIAGALGAMMLLSEYVGGGMSLPHYEWDRVEIEEIAWMIPLSLVGALGGWLFSMSDALFGRLSDKAGDTIAKPVIAGLVLGVCGVVLPFTMFSGEAEITDLNGTWATISAVTLLATGIVKILATAMCVNMGWRGGHFFPIIFAGVSIGYGMAALTGVDPVFSLCVVTAGLIGGVMRKPLMSVLLLFLCFPILAVIPMAISAFIGSRIPLPKWAREDTVSRYEEE